MQFEAAKKLKPHKLIAKARRKKRDAMETGLAIQHQTTCNETLHPRPSLLTPPGFFWVLLTSDLLNTVWIWLDILARVEDLVRAYLDLRIGASYK